MIMKTIDYTTHGTCSRSIHIELDGHTVHNVSFLGGCPGNTVGVARLAEGREAEELIRLLKGFPAEAKTPPARISWRGRWKKRSPKNKRKRKAGNCLLLLYERRAYAQK